MEYKLAIDSSSMHPTVAIFGGNNLVFDSHSDYQIKADTQREKDVCKIIDAGLINIGIAASELAAIFVCRGPGALNSTRAGVAIANSLGYSLAIPVYSFTSFQLIKESASTMPEVPLLITIRAANHHCYSCIFTNDTAPIIGYGPLKDLITSIKRDFEKVMVVGSHNEQIFEALGGAKVQATDIISGKARDALKINHELVDNTYPRAVIPLTEQSSEFT